MNNEKIVVRAVDGVQYETILEQIESSLDDSVSFLQSPLYGKLQENSGKNVVYFAAFQDKLPLLCGLGVRYTAPMGMNFLYIPYGPIIGDTEFAFSEELKGFLHKTGKSIDCAFVRIDSIGSQLDVGKHISKKVAATASLQPRAEWLLDITLSEEDLFMNMHKHARYNIRLAERADSKLKVFNPSDAPLDDFFDLMETTSGRDGFGIFDKSYYRAYLKAMSHNDGFMVVCYIDNKPAAAGLFVTHDAQSHYVFAGSSDDYRKIAPAYSVIWQAIKESKARGCTLFNFGGITDEVKGQNLSGVTSFKKRFSGYRVKHPNPVDIPVSKIRYSLFRLIKNIR